MRSILGDADRRHGSGDDGAMPAQQPPLVTTPAQLSAALARLGAPEVVGIDVERADADRYWRRPALIQLGARNAVVLVDPLALDDLSELDAFLADRTVVLHAMENDIAPLRSAGVELSCIEDTAVAAAVLGMPTGLEALLDQLLGVTFNGDKQRMQRADWSRRPLTDAMLDYAAADVADLPRLWALLGELLAESGRRSWYEQERDAVRGLPPVEERRAWTRLRGLGRLDRRAQTRARSLWQAREVLARDSDTAPNRILNDRALLDLASTPVDDIRGLRVTGMRRQAVRQFGAALLAALADGQRAALVPARGRRLDESDRALVDELRMRRSQIAADVQIDPGVLCPNRALEHAVAVRPATADQLRAALDVRPWQWKLVAPAFTEALQQAQVGTSLSFAASPNRSDAPKEQMMADVLNPDALHHELNRLDGWEGTSKEGISKRYTLDDFAGSIAFVNRLADHAERAGHHPDLAISWDTVTVTYVTHSAGGVTQADIEQARAVDGLPA
jgi:ribonuclease D